ncbi:keratin-associated protein 5-4-like [Homarus americanus]|uniref:keratin-associated protein 5-4-like n=1 Tax=Homarus americanus TaxID=6706 RepID=UPI001C494F7B|nr:keratin-associated protein 5-4-like [Homarus americanus]
MGVDKVALSSSKSWDLPLAAIFCIAIAAYVILVIIGLSIRQCLLRKGVCGGGCPYALCCNCSQLGLHCAQVCCNCGPKPSCTSLLDYCCPTDQVDNPLSEILGARDISVFRMGCSCLHLECCEECTGCSRFSTCGEKCCQDSWCIPPAVCGAQPSCDCQSCTSPQCSTINCLCCEITIKGRGPQEER